MKYINIGKITSTHGIKGELKIKSNFRHKSLVFKNDNYIYFGKEHEQFKITSYRPHKGFDMITINNIYDINKVINYVSLEVYFNSDDLSVDYLDEDLKGFDIIFNNEIIGQVIDIIDAGSCNYLIKTKDFYIPKNDHFIKNINLKEKKIEVININEVLL